MRLPCARRMAQASLTADKVLLLDPNTWSTDGTVALKVRA